MKNFIQHGEGISVAAPATVVSGQGVLVGGLFGVALADAASGDQVVLRRLGVFDLPKLSAQAWTVGAKVYWNAAGGECTTVASGNTLIGVAAAAAANPSASAAVLLDGAVR